MRSDLHPNHQPRPWSCSGPSAVYCTIHGDCTCQRRPARRDANCHLHGAVTAHGKAAPMLVDRPHVTDSIAVAVLVERGAA